MPRFVLLAVFFVYALQPLYGDDDSAPDVAAWTYLETATAGGEPYGPSNWSQGYPDCGGNAQSPINLAVSTHSVVESTQFDLEFFPHTCKAKDLFFIANERVWEVVFEGCSKQASLSFNSETYNLVQIHIHSPSEHAIGGSLRAAEIHWVHVKDGKKIKNKDQEGTADELLVVGVLFDNQQERARAILQLQPLWEVLDSGEDSTSASFETRIYDLIPPNKVFSHYMGSLTTPPCTEGVTWIVMNKPAIISKTQLDAFRASVAMFDDSKAHIPHPRPPVPSRERFGRNKADEQGNTNRPYQPLNDRDVFLVKA